MSMFDKVKDDLVTESRKSAIQYELESLRARNQAFSKEVLRLREIIQRVALTQARKVEKRNNVLTPSAHMVEDRGRVHKLPMGRTASMASTDALKRLQKAQDVLAQGTITALENPFTSAEYLGSQSFAADLVALCRRVRHTFEAEPRCLFVQSPVYVFGDIHGNLEDLRFFSDNVWVLGVPLTAGNFLFLGDYVDRGMHSVEVVAYMFALKLLTPHKVFLLRGNHELRDVNGWEEQYKEKCFLSQCKTRFGDELGAKIWEEVNQVFDRLPLAAVIDNDIFCVHGGIPRPSSAGSTRVEDILMVPPVAGVSPHYAHEDESTVRVASECVWSDPAKEGQEGYLDKHGYGSSPRGVGAVCFGTKAVDHFLETNNFSYIVRAHEAHSEGVSVSKGARVVTVFSTSKDHNQGQGAMAGCILIDNKTIQIINRSPRYKNRVIRRRCSAAGMGLPSGCTDAAQRLGLIVDTASSNDLLKTLKNMVGPFGNMSWDELVHPATLGGLAAAGRSSPSAGEPMAPGQASWVRGAGGLLMCAPQGNVAGRLRHVGDDGGGMGGEEEHEEDQDDDEDDDQVFVDCCDNEDSLIDEFVDSTDYDNDHGSSDDQDTPRLQLFSSHSSAGSDKAWHPPFDIGTGGAVADRGGGGGSAAASELPGEKTISQPPDDV